MGLTVLNIFSQFAFQLVVAELLFAQNKKKRNKFGLRTVIIFIPLLLIYGIIEKSSIGTEQLLLQYLGFAGVILYTAIGLYLCIKCTVNELIFCVSGAYALQNMNYNLYRIAICFLAFDDEGLYPLVQIVIMLLVYGVFSWLLLPRLKVSEELVMSKGRLIINAVLIFIMASFMSPAIPDIDSKQKIYFYLYAITGDILVLCVQFGLFYEGKLQHQNLIVEQLLHMERRQHEMSRDNIELINMKCHDLRHQIAAFKAKTDNAEQEKLMQKIEDSIQIYDSSVKTGNEALDVVLMEKLLQCKRYNINLTYMVDGKLLSFMETYDIASLFGNALENAIDSVSNIEDVEKRNISFYVRKQGQLLKIGIDNYFEGTLQLEDGLPTTTKEDKRYHGFGIKSMNHIAKQYGGTLSVAVDKQIFSLSILIPIQG